MAIMPLTPIVEDLGPHACAAPFSVWQRRRVFVAAGFFTFARAQAVVEIGENGKAQVDIVALQAALFRAGAVGRQHMGLAFTNALERGLCGGRAVGGNSAAEPHGCSPQVCVCVCV